MLGGEMSGFRHIQITRLNVMGCYCGIDSNRSQEKRGQRDDTNGEHDVC